MLFYVQISGPTEVRSQIFEIPCRSWWYYLSWWLKKKKNQSSNEIKCKLIWTWKWHCRFKNWLRISNNLICRNFHNWPELSYKHDFYMYLHHISEYKRFLWDWLSKGRFWSILTDSASYKTTLNQNSFTLCSWTYLTLTYNWIEL